MSERTSNLFVRMKKPHRNVYGLPRLWLKAATIFCIAFWVLLLPCVLLQRWTYAHTAAAAVAAVLAALAAVWPDRSDGSTVQPYCRKPDFEFLGLHELKDYSREGRHDVIPRDLELDYMGAVAQPQQTKTELSTTEEVEESSILL